MDALKNPQPQFGIETSLCPEPSGLASVISTQQEALSGNSLEAPLTMPPEAPLAMPTQSLARFDRVQRHKRQRTMPSAWRVLAWCWLARLFVFGGAAGLSFYGGWQMYEVVSVGGVTLLEWALVILFIANFSWISLAFTSAMAGFLWLFFSPPKISASPRALTVRTAIVMPIYNETPARVFGALGAIYNDVAENGQARAFDWFFLSDTTDPEIYIAEERAFLALRETLGPQARVFYRHRPKNTARKAGNIEDFVTRWGGDYPQMVVLDADSLMTGEAIVALAQAMEQDPDAGIIQTLPLIINRNTLFARVQQFAARIYGPVIAAGVTAWMGREGNYWGHNAIIRTRAFAGHCGLPTLRGRPPFGGLILSHDFVEAALMLRAGYSVYMLPDLSGSFEESPPSLIDLSSRDRRWCQGNLQHLRVLPAKGLRLASRQHLATGIMGYVTSPLWMAQLVIGIILVLQASYIKFEYFSSDASLFPVWPRFDAERSLALFGLTMAILLMPKLLGMLLALAQTKTRRGCGGFFCLFFSTLFEIFMSALLAPIMMLIQTGHVMHFLFGLDTGWNPQRRDDGSIPFRDIVRRHQFHVVMGFTMLIAGFLVSPSLVAWMSPTILGLLLAIFVSWGTGLLSVGLALRDAGLLLTPEETEKPGIVLKSNKLGAEIERMLKSGSGDGLMALATDPRLKDLHQTFLPQSAVRALRDIPVEWALAKAKLEEAASVEELSSVLKPKERMALLLDKKLVGKLAHLPSQTFRQEETPRE